MIFFVKFEPKRSSNADIEKIIKTETGYDIKLNQKNVKISKLRSLDNMLLCFAEVMPGIQKARVALLPRKRAAQSL